MVYIESCVSCKTLDEGMSVKMGGSLPAVIGVEPFPSSYSGDVPPRYFRPELHFEEVLVDEHLQIPTMDMGKLMVDDDDEMCNIHSACTEWGFFQLINHGAAEIVEKMKAVVQEFFRLPLEEKNAYAKQLNGIQGFGHNVLHSTDQKLDWAYTLVLQTLPASYRTMRFWPQEPTSFREALDNYSAELTIVSECLLKVMAKNLGVDPEQLLTMFENGRQVVRMNYYPPCVHVSKVIGLTPHSDFGGLTLLVRVNEVHGLQIKKKGKWVPIRPLPGAMIVNVGDAFEIMSKGEYKSMEHRVVVNPEKERLSIAAFHLPGAVTIIGPLPELTKVKCAIYKSLSRDEYIKFFISTKGDGKFSMDGMKLKN